MSTCDVRVVGEQGRELTLAQQPGELSTVSSTPSALPMLEENTGMGLDGEPAIGRSHGPILADANRLGHERNLVGFVSNMFDNGIGNNEIEGVVGERQMSAVGNDEVLPRDRMLGASVEFFEQDSAGHEHVGNLGHAIRNDVLEGLVLPGLCSDDQHGASTKGADHSLNAVGLAVSVIDAEAASGGRDEVAHGRSLWQALVAKPMASLALVAVCLVGAACSTVSTQEGTRVLPEAVDGSDSPSQQTTPDATESAAPDGADATSDSAPSDAQTPDTPATDSAGSDSDRGGRNLGSDAGALDDDDAAVTETPAAAATPTPEPPASATEAPASDAPESTETPVATTPPLPTVAPLATAAPVAAVQPTSTPVPEPVVVAQVPAGPLPSDDIVVEGPATVDESLPAGISNNGASACAATESAIEFLDFGDTNRMAGALAEASRFAGQASEPELVALAPELAAAGTNEEAAISTIIATLGACAVYGYQV